MRKYVTLSRPRAIAVALAKTAVDLHLREKRTVVVDGATPEAGEDVVVIQASALRKRTVSGAAQFLWNYRAQFRRTGAVDFEQPKEVELPPWLAVVFNLLRQRPHRWRVTRLRGRGGGTTWRVQWLGWMQQRRVWRELKLVN